MSEHDDRRLLREAIALSRHAPASNQAFSVGSVIVAADGRVLASGYSRERGGHTHAEEIALDKAAAAHADLHGATLYTSLEPCSIRASGLRACAARIVAAGITRVVFALREPPVFVEGAGAKELAAQGVEVVEMQSEAPEVVQINAHVMR